MGEANRVVNFGPQARVNHAQPPQGQQIQIDLKNATPKLCSCNCDIFIPGVKLFTVSALVSPTGQELLAQQPCLVCSKCNQVVAV